MLRWIKGYLLNQQIIILSVCGSTLFLPVRRYASASNSDCNVSVCLSVRHGGYRGGSPTAVQA